MKLRLCTIIACVAVSGVMFAGCRSSTVATGEPLNFSATTIDGQSFSTADHRGRVLLVNFFATWCPPCIEEMPALAEMYQRYNPQGLDMVAVGADPREDAAKVQQFAAQHAIPFPVIAPDRQVLESVGGVRSFPTTLIIDRQGVVRHRIVGAHLKQIEDAIQAMLKE